MSLMTQRKVHWDEILVQEGHVSIWEAKVENWDRWVHVNGKEVVSFVRQKHRQEIDAERISQSQVVAKVTNQPNTSTIKNLMNC